MRESNFIYFELYLFENGMFDACERTVDAIYLFFYLNNFFLNKTFGSFEQFKCRNVVDSESH